MPPASQRCQATAYITVPHLPAALTRGHSVCRPQLQPGRGHPGEVHALLQVQPGVGVGKAYSDPQRRLCFEARSLAIEKPLVPLVGAPLLLSLKEESPASPPGDRFCGQKHPGDFLPHVDGASPLGQLLRR